MWVRVSAGSISEHMMLVVMACVGFGVEVVIIWSLGAWLCCYCVCVSGVRVVFGKSRSGVVTAELHICT